MSDDHDLRSRLQRIASSAGDPPEHGLERIAARRHRRLRRRRGAVATAAVLAVLAAGISLINEGADRRDRVTASGVAPPAGAPPEVPRILDVRCEPSGIVVPVASVRAQNDGLHIRVHNLLDAETTIRVTGRAGWSSGTVEVPIGTQAVRQPVPPGRVTIGCTIGGDLQRRQVNLVDPAGYYTSPVLECDDLGVERLRDLPVDPPKRSLVAAARHGLDAHITGGTRSDAAVPPRGYPNQKLGDPTDDPTVQLEREGAVIALVHLRGEDGATQGPWVRVHRAEVCASLWTGGEATTSEATTGEGTGSGGAGTGGEATTSTTGDTGTTTASAA